MADEPSSAVEILRPTSGEFRWSIVVSETRREGELPKLLDRAIERTGESSVIQLWVREVSPGDDEAAKARGFVAYRDLWQLRCELPQERSTISTRSFEPGDLTELVRVNNRAFHWHPEQGGRTADQFRQTMAEPWFDPKGLRIHQIEGRLAGFCWTKVHSEPRPPMGEIYVIAVDPDFHGRGLGGPMTRAGLDWLADQGLRHAMLYVEADNEPANATYARIGFARHHTDRAYRLDPRR